MKHETNLTVQKFPQAISDFSNRVGRLVSWLSLVMVLLSFTVVILRKFFGMGWIWMQESVTWMHALVFMLAAAYTLNADEHVRVDIFYTKFSAKQKSLVNLCGTVILLLPMCAFIIWSSWDYVAESWRVRETSWQSGGLPALFLLKSIIPITAVLLALQGVSKAVADFLHSFSKNDEKERAS